MKGDFSRNTFDPAKHFKGVRMQQGRVQLDADWNENLDILLHRIETGTMDVVGLCGFPIHNTGFGVVADPSLLTTEEQDALTEKGLLPLEDGDFLLTAGRGYVDGILCENGEWFSFSQQPYLLPHPVTAFPSDGSYALYLDVWERLVTVLEDPSIREVALGGPDTAVRSQIIWQVKFVQAGDTKANIDCNTEINGWPPSASDGTLCARTHPEKVPDDPCYVAPSAGYKRLENQLYRVEIHKASGDAGGPTFLFSRDNGSVVVKVEEFNVDGSADKVRVASLGRDDVLGLHELDWVEVLDDATELAGKPGFLVQIDKIDRERLIVTLKQNVSGFDLAGHAKLRRWDSDGELKVEVPTTNDGYIPLEGGIEVHFDTSKTYHIGDYWLIPARTVPGQYGDIEWPKVGTDPACLTPMGIKHHYCKLAIVVVEDGVITEVTDCRPQFPPLTELPSGGESCCSVTVGESGDFVSLQEAVDARPADANFWNICLLPGEHKLQKTVQVSGQTGISISGCSEQTLILGAAGQPILVVQSSSRVRVDGLMFKANTPLGAILALGCMDISVTNCKGENIAEAARLANLGSAVGPMLVAVRCKQLTVRGNSFRGLPAVMVQGNTILVDDNFFTGGGAQVLFGSQTVAIENNLIFKGVGPGIQLSGLSSLLQKEAAAGGNLTDYQAAYVEETGFKALQVIRETHLVTIKHNMISGMQGSGILTLNNMLNLDELGEVSYLLIEHNQIAGCALTPDMVVSKGHIVGGGINLSSVSDVTIHGNLVAYNGGNSPACGIIVTNGANVEITDNDVIENGNESTEAGEGYQAGIAALYVLGNDTTLTDILGENKSGIRLGVPALRVQGNQVTVPAGMALTALTMGTTQISDNVFVTRGPRQQPALIAGLPDVASVVQVFNYGYQAWMSGFVGGADANFHFDVGAVANLTEAQKSVPDGRIMFHDNQLTAIFPARDATEQRTISAAGLFFSLDDVSLQDNQVQSDVTPDRLLLDVMAVGTTIRAQSNNFSEPAGSAFFSYVSQAALMNSTIANQAVHCILTGGTQKIETNNMVMLSTLCLRFANFTKLKVAG